MSYGGTLNGVTVLSGGEIEVLGGTVTGLTLGSGATEIDPQGILVSPGSPVSGAVLTSGGYQIVAPGGEADGTVVSNGGNQIVYGVASAALVLPSFESFEVDQIIEQGGLAEATQVSGTTEEVFGSASGTVIIDEFATQIVERGGFASSTTVNEGTQVVYGSAAGVILSYGSETIFSGGVVSNLTILGQGASYLSAAYLSASGTGTDVTVSADVLYVESGGVGDGITVSNGGNAVVYAGATVSDITVESGGRISSFESLSGLTLESGAAEILFQTISSGMTVSGAVISAGGSQTILAGGIANSTTIIDAYQIVYGTADGVSVSSGNSTVSAGGLVSGIVLEQGGGVTVDSGGQTYNVTVSDGGVSTSFRVERHPV